MKSLDAPTLAHLAGEELTLSTCWKIEAEGLAAVGFTDHDVDLTVSGLVYSSLGGYAPTNIQSTSALSVDNLDIKGLLSTLGITDADIQAGIYDYAQVWIFQTNWADTSQIIPLKYGHLGEVRTNDAFLAEFRSLSQLLSQTIGSVITADCRAELGDSDCGVQVGDQPTLFRYWRLYTTANNGDAFTQVFDFQGASITGGDNVFSGGTPISSTGANPERAFDSSITTSWGTTGGDMPNYIGYDFGDGNGVSLAEIRLICNSAAVIEQRAPKDFSVQHSDDGVTWTTASSFTGETSWGNGEIRTFAVAEVITSSPYRVTGSVVSVTDRSKFTDTARTEADDYFKYGLLTWTSGLNNGYSMEVKNYTLSTGEFELFEPMPYAIAVADTYSVYAGCDKFFSTCKDKFSNVVNFRGEPHVPTQDQISTFGGQ